MDHEASRTSSASGDFEEDAEEDYEDDEATLDEEESFLRNDDDLDNSEELALLAEEGEMSVEELRRKYLGEAVDSVAESSSSSHSSLDNSNNEDYARRLATSMIATSATYFTDEILNDENDDEEYTPPDPYKKLVRVGPDYQVDFLPKPRSQWSCSVASNESESSQDVEEKNDLDHADPLWLPSFDVCSMTKLERYLSDCEKIRLKERQSKDSSFFNSLATFPLFYNRNAQKNVFDDENALYALYKANYVVDKAKEKAPFTWPSHQSVNGPRLTYTEPWRRFTEEDCSNFEEGIRIYGKNFFAITKNVMTDRTVGELVRFYYSWKKSERHDMFIEKVKQLASNQRNESVATTDYMGNIMTTYISKKEAERESNKNKVNGPTDQISSVLSSVKNSSEWLNVKSSETMNGEL